MSWVLFFDGDCAFCSRVVRRVVAFDRHGRISFAPLQGKLAAKLDLARYAVKTGGTMILLREADGAVFMKSDALIELASALGGLWRVMTLFRFIPRWLRDYGYGWIADNRHRLMSKSESCLLPDPELARRLRE